MIYLVNTVIIVILLYLSLTNRNKRENKVIEKKVPVKRLSLDERLKQEKEENLVKLVLVLTEIEKKTAVQLVTIIDNLKQTKTID
ncbi:hypothetical protein [Enterococcus sp. UD-01]|jgi:hypothetical protein|uniref:hypothetical protein n=1 Tax=Enterococcus sp. UD-01 TaxID=3373911 RepID=UPI0038341450